jgi:hypothetical protein
VTAEVQGSPIPVTAKLRWILKGRGGWECMGQEAWKLSTWSSRRRLIGHREQDAGKGKFCKAPGVVTHAWGKLRKSLRGFSKRVRPQRCRSPVGGLTLHSVRPEVVQALRVQRKFLGSPRWQGTWGLWAPGAASAGALAPVRMQLYFSS